MHGAAPHTSKLNLRGLDPFGINSFPIHRSFPVLHIIIFIRFSTTLIWIFHYLEVTLKSPRSCFFSWKSYHCNAILPATKIRRKPKYRKVDNQNNPRNRKVKLSSIGVIVHTELTSPFLNITLLLSWTQAKNELNHLCSIRVPKIRYWLSRLSGRM